MMDALHQMKIGPKAIYKLVYRSKIAIIRGHADIEREVENILDWSITWNFRHGITGALLLDEHGFAQVLEGPAYNVKSLFGHIACDPRHKDVELLYCDFHEDRDFREWTMAFVDRQRGTESELGATDQQRDAAIGDGADDIIGMLKGVLADQL